jgi:hypothetical protein
MISNTLVAEDSLDNTVSSLPETAAVQKHLFDAALCGGPYAEDAGSLLVQFTFLYL